MPRFGGRLLLLSIFYCIEKLTRVRICLTPAPDRLFIFLSLFPLLLLVLLLLSYPFPSFQSNRALHDVKETQRE